MLGEEVRYSTDVCFNDIAEVVNKCEETLVRIYDNSSVLHDIEYYMDNSTLKEYLEGYAQNKKKIQEWEREVEFGLVFLDMKDLVTRV